MRTVLLAFALLVPQDEWRATGAHGEVAAGGGKGAVAAGIGLLKSGGNAADSAVAATT